jgi:hypothetical protein
MDTTAKLVLLMFLLDLPSLAMLLQHLLLLTLELFVREVIVHMQVPFLYLAQRDLLYQQEHLQQVLTPKLIASQMQLAITSLVLLKPLVR